MSICAGSIVVMVNPREEGVRMFPYISLSLCRLEQEERERRLRLYHDCYGAAPRRRWFTFAVPRLGRTK